MSGVVQCGWCPVMLADDYRAWYRHHEQVHGVSGYSVRHIRSSDWDISELTASADNNYSVKLDQDSE